MIESTSKFRVFDVVYNKNSFAIARGHWEGSKDLNLACRWHSEDGIGYPQTFGKPQWMQLPDWVDVELSSGIDPASAKVTITFN